MNIQHPTSNIQRRTRGVWCLRSVLGVLVIGAALSTVAQQTNTDTVPSSQLFKIIWQRNIFDPNRSGYRDITRTPRNAGGRALDAFALVGTMSYTKGRFAFFDGSNSQYKKVVEPGGNIAGYTVKEVTQDAITLAANGKEFQMKVGAQMRNPGDNKWQLSGHVIEEPTTDETNGDTAAAESSAPPAGANAQISEVLKKLMQQRNQELK